MEMERSTGWQGRKTGKMQSIPVRVEPAVHSGRPDLAYYRRLIYLKNDKRIMLRLLHEGDWQDLINLFQEAAAEELRFFKHDLKNQRLLNHWLNHMDHLRVLPLVAVDLETNRVIAAATLLKGKHSARHIGEIKIFISEPFRLLGLGSRMLDELVHLASQEKLFWLKAELVADQKHVIKALRAKGFQTRAVLEDFFTRKDGVTHDVVLMMRPVMGAAEEF